VCMGTDTGVAMSLLITIVLLIAGIGCMYTGCIDGCLCDS
jgi:hypothetical protein